MKLKVISGKLIHNGVIYEAGGILDLTTEEAEMLLKLKVLEAVASPPAPKSPAPKASSNGEE